MTRDLCPHDADDPLCCPPCQHARQGRSPVQTLAELGWGLEFPARYTGRCHICDGGIEEGDPIRGHRQHLAGPPDYAHSGCVEAGR